MKKIAFIGVGVMGKSMVLNLAKAGYHMHIHTRTKEKVEDIISEDIIWYDCLETCVQEADIIMTMVGFPKDVEDIYYGEGGIIKQAKENAILIDFTTSSPSLAKSIYEDAKKEHKYSLDAPVSGGDVGAKNATLSIMVGGDQDIFDQVYPILKTLGTTITYTGIAGNGQHTKMTNQIALAGAIAGVCEALAYANQVGLDKENMLACIAKGAAGSWQMSNMAPRILNKDLNPGFYIKHYIKDMNIAKSVMDDKNINLDVLNTVLAMYRTLQEKGFEDLGTQALIKYYNDK